MTHSIAEVSKETSPREPAPDPKLVEVRGLLMGRDYAELLALRERLGNPQALRDSVSGVLTEAITVRARSDDSLSQSLRPTIERALLASVREEPQPLVDALFPIIGPMIRKSIREAFNSAVQALNQTMEQSLSVSSIKHRLEAKRTGRSYAEVVMLRTLVYRVEQVFLIHRTTGLLLQHAVSDDAIVKDPDMISGMLSAVQSFIEDSFKTQRLDGLNEMRVGDLMVQLEAGPAAVVAAVVRGRPPSTLRRMLQETLEQLHRTHGNALLQFKGDAEPFGSTQALLTKCLAQEVRATDKKRNRWLLPAILVAITLPLIWWGAMSYQERAMWGEARARLSAEPGLVIVETGTQGGRYFVRGLRDARARDSNAVIGERAATQLAVDWRWQPYISVEPAFVLARAEQALRPPSTVTMRLDDGLLSIWGIAPRAWVEPLLGQWRYVPGVTGFDTTRLLALEQLVAQFDDLRGQIDAVSLQFASGVDALDAAQIARLDAIVPTIAQLFDTALLAQLDARVRIDGYADAPGTIQQNHLLGQSRAEAVHAALLRAGLDAEKLLIAASRVEQRFGANARRVELKVVASATPTPPPPVKQTSAVATPTSGSGR